MEEFVNLVTFACQRRDFSTLAQLLWIPQTISTNPQYSEGIALMLGQPCRFPAPQGVPLAEVLHEHFKALSYISQGRSYDNVAVACAATASALQAMVRSLTAESRQELSVLKRLCLNLLHLSMAADRLARTSAVHSTQREEAARQISKAFTACITDRASMENSKKWAVLNLANLLFRLYFDLGTVRLGGNIARAIDTAGNVDFPSFDKLPKADVVPYYYYRGRMFVNQGHFKQAEEHFSEAGRLCSDQFPAQKR